MKVLKLNRSFIHLGFSIYFCGFVASNFFPVIHVQEGGLIQSLPCRLSPHQGPQSSPYHSSHQRLAQRPPLKLNPPTVIRLPSLNMNQQSIGVNINNRDIISWQLGAIPTTQPTRETTTTRQRPRVPTTPPPPPLQLPPQHVQVIIIQTNGTGKPVTETTTTAQPKLESGEFFKEIILNITFPDEDAVNLNEFPELGIIYNDTELDIPVITITITADNTLITILQPKSHRVIDELTAISYSVPTVTSEECSKIEPMKIKFYFFTTQSPTEPILLNVASKEEISKLDQSLQTKIITHGWLGRVEDEWLEEIREAYFEKGVYNIILVDWSEYAFNIYSIVACHAEHAGKLLGKLIAFLVQNYNFDLEKMHLIGHSIGAHLMGLAGQEVLSLTKKRVGRITGLDPSRPLYCHPKLADADKRLSRDDATFVDAVHTDNTRFGCERRLGHVDVFVNCGKEQPNCDARPLVTIEDIIRGILNFHDKVTCSHTKAINYWISSIRTEDLGARCVTCKTFEAGNCPGTTVVGEHVSKRENGLFYVAMK